MLPSCEHLHIFEIFSRLPYIFDATLLRSSLDCRTSLMLRWGGEGWGKMLPSCEHLHIFDATLLRSSLDFHTSLMLPY